MMRITQGGLNFDTRPRTSAILILLGIAGFIYAAAEFGAAVALLGKLR
jgi:hypothetical protein